MRTSIFGAVAIAFANLSLAAPTATVNAVETPLPTQPGMVDNCEVFHLVKKDQTCRGIARSYGVVESDIKKWNPTVGDDCTLIWANYHVCVRTIGYVPSVEKTCYAGVNTKLWGDNRPYASTAAVNWCMDAAGSYAPEQGKSGCWNAGLGNNKFNFEIQNPFGTDKTKQIDQLKCTELVMPLVNDCARGGTLESQGWIVSASVTAGRCF
ncbi:LysM domain-containing protein [Paramyrothecium foliicola]|nr:LysM domain-containing protein [Paramyrothecium foliicola]